MILEAQPQFQLDPDKLNDLYHSGATPRQRYQRRRRASTSFRHRHPASAGSNATDRRSHCTRRSSGSSDSACECAHRQRTATSSWHRFAPARNASSTIQQRGAAQRLHALRHRPRSRSRSITRASSRRSRSPSTWRRTLRWAMRIDRHQQGRRRTCNMPASVQADFQGTARPSETRCPTKPLLILAALVTVYIVLGVLYESFIHPITILSTLPSAGVGALLALMLFRTGSERRRDHRHHPADRHREEERHHDGRLRAGSRARTRARARPRPSTRPACCASARS